MPLPRAGVRLALILSAILVVFGISAVPVGAAEPPGWSQETVAPSGVARAHLRDVELRRTRDGRLIALAVRSSVDWSSAGLTFLERSPGTAGVWRVLAKTSNFDVAPSLALSVAGAVHAAWVREGSGIRYTSNRTGTWVVEVIPGGQGGESPSIALTNGGTPSIAFSVPISRTSHTLRVASKTASGWTLRTVATGDVGQPSLKIDQSGKRHLVYVRRTGSAPGLYYATDRSGSWRTTRLTSAPDVESPRLVLDSTRHVHVAYVRASLTLSRVLYVTNATGPWVTSTVSAPAGGSGPEITLDGAGRPVVAYVAARPYEGGAAWVAERAGTIWVRSAAIVDQMAGRPGLALDGAALHLLALRPFADPQGAGELVHATR